MKKICRNICLVLMALIICIAFLPVDSADAATVKKKIKLNKTSVTLYAGKTVKLKVTGTTKKVTWTTSNKKVATVYKGKVTTKKAGTATITAKVGQKNYKCKVTVKKPYLNKTSTSVFAGKTVKLKLTGATVKSYTSKNKAVATVTKKGLVTTKQKGTVTIVAKDTKGRTYNCKITVKKPYLNKELAYLYIGKTTTLKLTGATAKSYTSKNAAVADVSKKGLITAKKKGTATIVVKDTKGRTYTCKVTVKKPYLNQTNINLGVGNTTKLKLTGATAKQWSSSNEKIVTVTSKGIVRARYEGTATITCIAKDGQTFSAKVTTHCYNHTDATTLIKEATCLKTGTQKHYCLTCDYSYNQVLVRLAHDYIYTETVLASKNGPGYDAYHCSMCQLLDPRNQVDYNPTVEQVYEDMIAMQASHPEGMTWTNDNFYQWKGGYFTGGYGCAGFAFMLSDAAFGYLPATKHEDFDAIKAGDILRLNDDGHSVVVLSISDGIYTLAEGNFNNSVHWGRTMTLAEIKETGTYVMTRYPQ